MSVLKWHYHDFIAGSQGGYLHNIYYDVLPDWFQYGNNLNVPSVKMHSFSLTPR